MELILAMFGDVVNTMGDVLMWTVGCLWEVVVFPFYLLGFGPRLL